MNQDNYLAEALKMRNLLGEKEAGRGHGRALGPHVHSGAFVAVHACPCPPHCAPCLCTGMGHPRPLAVLVPALKPFPPPLPHPPPLVMTPQASCTRPTRAPPSRSSQTTRPRRWAALTAAGRYMNRRPVLPHISRFGPAGVTVSAGADVLPLHPCGRCKHPSPLSSGTLAPTHPAPSSPHAPAGPEPAHDWRGAALRDPVPHDARLPHSHCGVQGVDLQRKHG